MRLGEAHAAGYRAGAVVANPANTNALILKENAPSIPAENITCLTRLDHNRALGQVWGVLHAAPACTLEAPPEAAAPHAS